MKILLEFTTLNYKMWHSMAKRLKEIFPETKFAGITRFAPLSEKQTQEFLLRQSDIKYEFIYNYHEITVGAFKSEIDFVELQQFEQKLAHKSLWRLIAADEYLGSQFMHDSIWVKLFINQNNTYENILRFFNYSLKRYREIFEEFKPDLFLPGMGLGTSLVFILEQICRERNIPYIVPTTVRIRNLFVFSTDVQQILPHIENTYKKLLNGRGDDIDLSSARKLYEELQNELPQSQYFERQSSYFNVSRLDTFGKKIQFFLSLLKSLAKVFWQWERSKALRKSDDIRRQPNSFTAFWSNISYVLHQKYQNFLMLKPNSDDKLKAAQKYIYYPLYVTPEHSTQIIAPMWQDQLYIIELLAKSIPADWLVYVKEHPVTLPFRARPYDFYKKIKRLPNTRLIPIDTDMHQLISHAEMVAVITGTSGWEAILRGKPLITFGDCFWDILDLSKKCTDVELLSKCIYDEIRRIKEISSQERKRRLVYLLAAILRHGFEVSYPRELCGSKKGTDKEYEVVGREVAEALKKHLDYFQKEK